MVEWLVCGWTGDLLLLSVLYVIGNYVLAEMVF